MARTLLDVPVSEIEIPKTRKKRVDLDTDLGSTTLASIRDQGILHPPLVQTPKSPGGKYQLVFGQLRLACAQKLGHKTIRVTVDDAMNDQDAEFALLAENLFRRGDKSAVDRARLFRRWWDIHSLKLEELCTTDRSIAHQYPQSSCAQERKRTAVRFVESTPVDESSEQEDIEEEVTEHEDAQIPVDQGVRLQVDDMTKSFERKVQEATGLGKRQAQYDVAIAKAFDEEQLCVIDSLGLSGRDMRELAKLKDKGEQNVALTSIGLGKSVKEAIAEAGGIAEKIVERRRMEGDDLTDGEWLDTQCHEIRSRLGNTKAFDTSAILYRKVRRNLGVCKHGIAPELKSARLKRAADPLTRLLSMTMSVNHPRDWHVCGVCNGSGSVNGEHCDTCQGACFKLSYGAPV